MSSPARAVFMGTPEFAVASLVALSKAYQVVAVYTRRDQPAGRGRRLQPSAVKRVAESLGLPVIQPRSFRRDPEAAAAVGAHQADVVVVAAYGLILTAPVLDAAPFGALNVHASLLPRWRGAAPVQRAILAGDETTGVTIMRMDAGIDTGDMLARSLIDIGPQESGGELTERLAETGARLLLPTLEAWLAGRLVAEPQDPSIATSAPALRREDRILNWLEPAAALARRVRALAPTPGAQAFLGSEPLKVLEATAVDADSSAPPGTLLVGRGPPLVRCGTGALALNVVQPAGRRAMDGRSFVAGRPNLAGVVLPTPAALEPDRGLR